jgi:hypothetical protein
LLFSVLNSPSSVFEKIASGNSEVIGAVQRLTFFLILLPPVFAWIGSTLFGWRLGGGDPLYFDATARVIISFFYADALILGYISTVLIARWMAHTYGGENVSTESLFAFFTVVLTPICIASAAHLYPHIFFNVLVLIPSLLWAITLLYRGLPVVMKIPPERGMLMSSSLVGWLLVAFVSLLGLSAALWTYGIGPNVVV